MQQDTIVVHPDLAIKAIKTGIVPEFRAWLVFHAYSGNGFIEVADIYKDLASKKHPSTYLVGKKRMSMILRSGEGLFWNTVAHGNVLRLAGKKTLCERMKIDHLEFRSVHVEVKYLLASFKHTKAALLDCIYASFDRPISRATIEKITGISESTQYELEHLIGINVSSNYLWVEPEEDAQERAWKSGGKLTRRYDRKGKVTGNKDSFYYAEKMPNTYHSKQKVAGSGSRREYNKEHSSFRHTTSQLEKPKNRLYSTPESRSSKAPFEKKCDLLSQNANTITRLGMVGIWVKTWR